MRRRTLLRCLPAVPAMAAAAPASAVQAALVEPKAPQKLEVGDWDEERGEVFYLCEDCSAPIFEGDKRFSYADGPDFCEAHAPTWSDLKDMQDEAIQAGEFEDWFEDPEDAALARRNVLAAIENGDGDKKVVW